MKILITGIEGFVGHYLTLHLKERDYEVFGSHLLPVSQPIPDVRYYHCDILDYERLQKIISDIKPDGIFHLAAISSVAFSFSHPEETMRVNFNGTYNLLRAVSELALSSRILIISSSDVYGKVKEERPIREDSPLEPVSPYGLSKVCAEESARLFCRIADVDVVILRPFNHTGIGQREDFVFPYCAKRIAEIESGRGENFLELGNIDGKRDYLDVRDVVVAYEMAFRLGRRGEVYNVACGKPIKIREGVEFLISQTEKKIEILLKEERQRPQDITYLSGDPEKFFLRTTWRPKRDIRETLREMLEYYRSLHSRTM